MFTILFVAALLLTVAIKLYLAYRQARHVIAHRSTVPARFRAAIPLAAHQKAADYTVARVHLATIENLVEAALLVALTLGGGIQWIDDAITAALPAQRVPGVVTGIALIVAVILVSALVDLPFSLYRQFVLEARFGFNRVTPALFFADLAKGVCIGAVLGVPFLAAVLWLMARIGPAWWLYTWALWVVVQFSLMLLHPIVIAPLFNTFRPLADAGLQARIDALLRRCGFAAKGVFVMDGSRRSAHGNAYFWGFGASKRIVFFDTLLARLSAGEIEAVLAHELGHFKRHHVLKRLAFSLVTSLGGLALLGWLIGQPWFYSELGVEPTVVTRDAVALILFFYVLPVFAFLFSPLLSQTSRRQEYEADDFAAAQTGAADVVQALVKLYEDNASTLTPDPLHSAFYDSHPPAALRIQHLDAHAA